MSTGKSTIINIDGHKLVVITAPHIATDRGFIRFFDVDSTTILSDADLVQGTEEYGNSLYSKITDYILELDSKKMFKVDPDTIDLASLHARSWFNDIKPTFSAVVFDYCVVGTTDRKYGLTFVKWSSMDGDKVLLEAVQSNSIYEIDPKIGSFF